MFIHSKWETYQAKTHPQGFQIQLDSHSTSWKSQSDHFDDAETPGNQNDKEEGIKINRLRGSITVKTRFSIIALLVYCIFLIQPTC